MESANKSALFVLLLLLGVGVFLGRTHIMNLVHGKSAAASPSGSSLMQGGAVLVEAFGKPYISENAFNKKLEQMLQASPYTRSMDIATFPAEAKAKFLKDWVNFLLIKDIWGKEHNIEQDAAFQKRCEESMEALKDSLIIDAFVQDLKKKVIVSDDEISVEYHSNKDRYTKSQGGAHFVVAEYPELQAAKMLQQMAGGLKNAEEFIALVERNKDATYTDLGFVDSKSASIDAEIAKFPTEVRKVLFGRGKEAAVHIATTGKQFVVFACERKAADFFELDEIRPQVKMMLEETKQKEALEKTLEEMNTQANLVVKTEVWGDQPRVLSKEDLLKAIAQSEGAADADGEDVDVDMVDPESAE